MVKVSRKNVTPKRGRSNYRNEKGSKKIINARKGTFKIGEISYMLRKKWVNVRIIESQNRTFLVKIVTFTS